MTIEERAIEYANKLRSEAYCPAHGFGTGDYEPEEGLSEEEYTYSIDGYTTGATEQQEIDIQKAVEIYERELKQLVAILNRFSKDKIGDVISIEGSVKDFQNAMKEM